jgi:hypothetical protein
VLRHQVASIAFDNHRSVAELGASSWVTCYLVRAIEAQ